MTRTSESCPALTCTTRTDYGSLLDHDQGGWICALTHTTACKNETLSFIRIRRSQIHRWEVKFPVLVFFFPHNALTPWLRLIVPAFFLLSMRRDGIVRNNLVFFFPRQYNLMAFLSPGGWLSHSKHTHENNIHCTEFTQKPLLQQCL